MKRKTYIREHYSKYWIDARDNIYGFSEYDRFLCKLVVRAISPFHRLLEVGVGTGYPFADYFCKAGYEVHGIDLAPRLIEKCHDTNASIICSVGDAEDIAYANGYFDCCYCFHSSWYFPDIEMAIAEMIRVTKVEGTIFFDILNKNSTFMSKYRRQNGTRLHGLVREIVRQIKNVGVFVLKQQRPAWHIPVYETPADPMEISFFLDSYPDVDYSIYGRMPDGSLINLDRNNNPLADYHRLIFELHRKPVGCFVEKR